MPQDKVHEPADSKACDESRDDNTHERTPDDKQTDGGLTREELRALVIEMIG